MANPAILLIGTPNIKLTRTISCPLLIEQALDFLLKQNNLLISYIRWKVEDFLGFFMQMENNAENLTTEHWFSLK